MECDSKTFSYVLKLCKHFLRPPVDAEDVASEIILEALEKKYEKITYSLVRSRCYDTLRAFQREAAAREASVSFIKAARAVGDGEGCSDRNQQLTRTIGSAILSPQEQEIIYFKFYQGYSIGLISGMMNLPEYVCSRLLNETITKLRRAAERLK